MIEKEVDVLVIGAGAAGLGAAIGAAREGVDKVVIVERDERSGGILNQCIHNGFGLHYFREELTGPEYAERIKNIVKQYPNIDVKVEQYVHGIDYRRKEVSVVSTEGVTIYKPKSLVVATGARERPMGGILVPGTRPAGVFTAGVAQRFVNLENRLPGKKAIIVGSGDIGLIMARRLTLEGVEVVAVVERMPFPGGLERNIRQCLKDFNIPLYLSHTVVGIYGKERLERVIIAQLDENFKPIPGTEKKFDVDTLILSVGLIPQSTLFKDFLKIDPWTKGIMTSSSGRTSLNWIFAAGNCTVIYDLVDWVTEEGSTSGKFAAMYVKNNWEPAKFSVEKGQNVGLLFPTWYEEGTNLNIYIRVKKPLEIGTIRVKQRNNLLYSKKHANLMPSEMVNIRIPESKIGAGDIVVEVVE
ncbi:MULTISPECIES: NAD(P)/FAD-dependent oxidoreductase [Fervidobacterium]|uniref:FAD-dependent pyridine nucleotide-disulphide oxidoreductase n=1 Tax=Fervidobacterium nodosum (strain ATCC 35602 / DSM 5306 / Rt17-B1) TaxID=381764 RepID=A7HKX0_FERNB|nr:MULTISPECIES: FAD-dependent oxidoreductase [Fervidobacterium]ABS60553.1 FAD-dependent pyridine nucleotide-disulphide oxidoreductase [Fervidobacterium nodosum Rt17-B1]KAF2962485.1 pyridine nucleotide-disulfide oxidoreductase [Fervidobacterium sp. 2310opik-2]PHJ14109.1 pyridine nucleotide-disulfide oxidoreductase [Fervidobacterium sp. SC_NGM5_G05]HOJ93937.1 FAD-dependent oxidoreductase [Fervidobacterium nodosum]